MSLKKIISTLKLIPLILIFAFIFSVVFGSLSNIVSAKADTSTDTESDTGSINLNSTLPHGGYGRIMAEFVPDSTGTWRKTGTTDLSTYVDLIRKSAAVSPLATKLNDGSILFTDNSFALRDATSLTATCMFTGDLMCLKGQQFAAGVKSSYDFWPMYKYVAPIFSTADFVCGNLESLLSESNPITKNQVNAANGQPQCNGPKIYLNALRKAGFDMLVTANNHTCDWGATGITETKTHLEEFGFANTGTHFFEDPAGEEEDRFVIFDVNGIKLAILSYTHIINQRGYLNATQMDRMVHLFDREKVKADIDSAREKGADFVAVYCHWGIENTETLNSYQLNDSKFLVESGADLIIGSHPHCLQRCEYIESESGKKVLCMYSMGNFCSSMVRDINNDTIILKVTIEKSISENETTMTSASYIPCHAMTKDGHSFVVVPTSSDLNGGYKSSVLDSAKVRIDKIMNNVIPCCED